MISLNDVLLAMSNIPVDDPIAEIWGQGLQSGYRIIEYTGILPITINANGYALLDYRIYGADGGVGVATENLFDGEMESGYYDNNGEKQSSNNWIRCKNLISTNSNTVYHAIIDDPEGASGSVVFARCYDAGGEFIGTASQTVIQYYEEYAFTTLDNTAFISFYVSEIYRNAKFAIYQTTISHKPYIPYGYKLPMVVQSVNLFDPNAKNVDNGYIAKSAISYPDGRIHNASDGYNTFWVYVTEYIPVDSNTEYVIFTNLYRASVDWARGLAFYDENKNFIFAILGYAALTEATYESGRGRVKFTTPENCRYIRTNVDVGATMLMLVAASIPPPAYIPYSKQTTPIYIGENQLDAGEYVSYAEQKIYRDVGGTLTPTDPPVPLPEIPTIDGTTIIDCDGDPKPSQMYIKYKGNG